LIYPELHKIKKAGLKDNDPISDAASARISILCSQPSKPSNSSYHTACSNCPNDERVAIEPPESVPRLFYGSQWQRILTSLRTGMPYSEQDIPVDESTSGNLLLRAKARHLLSALPKSSSRRRVSDICDVASVIVPWVDGWPIGDDFHDLVTAVEGPLGNPYEGSVCYLRITLAGDHSYKAPDCRFLQRFTTPISILSGRSVPISSILDGRHLSLLSPFLWPYVGFLPLLIVRIHLYRKSQQFTWKNRKHTSNNYFYFNFSNSFNYVYA
jgi:hypothetical protein